MINACWWHRVAPAAIWRCCVQQYERGARLHNDSLMIYLYKVTLTWGDWCMCPRRSSSLPAASQQMCVPPLAHPPPPARGPGPQTEAAAVGPARCRWRWLSGAPVGPGTGGRVAPCPGLQGEGGHTKGQTSLVFGGDWRQPLMTSTLLVLTFRAATV